MAGLAGNGSGFTSGNPNAPQASQVAFIQGTGTISQAMNFSRGRHLPDQLRCRAAGQLRHQQGAGPGARGRHGGGHHHPHQHQLLYLHDSRVQRDGRQPHHQPSLASIPAGPTTPPSSTKSASTTSRRPGSRTPDSSTRALGAGDFGLPVSIPQARHGASAARRACRATAAASPQATPTPRRAARSPSFRGPARSARP